MNHNSDAFSPNSKRKTLQKTSHPTRASVLRRTAISIGNKSHVFFRPTCIASVFESVYVTQFKNTLSQRLGLLSKLDNPKKPTQSKTYQLSQTASTTSRMSAIVIGILFSMPLTGCLDGSSSSPDANQVVQPQGIAPIINEDNSTDNHTHDASSVMPEEEANANTANTNKTDTNNEKMKPLPKKHNGVVIDAGTLDNLVTEAANSGQYYQADEVPSVNQDTGQLDVTN